MWLGLVIFGCLILLFVIMFNSLVSRKNQVENAFASIDVYLKKRADQIPSLVKAVKGYMSHEKAVLAQITKLRTEAFDSKIGSNERVDVENKITDSMNKIMLAVEAYPDLKASDNFMQLQRSLNEVEEQLAASRRAFNASVTDYNYGVESFPMNIVALMVAYKRKNMFIIPMESRGQTDERPKIKL